MQLIRQISQQLRHRPQRKIIFSESDDPRVLQASARLFQEGVIRPILVGTKEFVHQKLAEIDPKYGSIEIEVVNPNQSDHITSFSEQLYKLRKDKGMTKQQAQQLVRKPLVFSYMMLRNDMADGAVNGALHPTSEVVRNAIQLIGLKEGSNLVSSFFIMFSEQTDQTFLFADCALVIEPDCKELCAIAYDTIKNAQWILTSQVRVAMLSFSTSGSAQHEQSQKVRDASVELKQSLPNVAIDGEIQFDAAIVPTISQQKYPHSQTQGQANVFIFPNLNAGNIGYKIAQRLGGFSAIGPILQGLAKPANDLSRGCSVSDIYNLALLTASQVQPKST